MFGLSIIFAFIFLFISVFISVIYGIRMWNRDGFITKEEVKLEKLWNEEEKDIDDEISSGVK